MRTFAVLALAAIVMTACASGSKATTKPSPSVAATAETAAAQLANGRSIFLTGRDRSGVRIHAQPAALRPSCAACHRPSGAGGIRLPGGVVSADLRHSALVTSQQPPYTIALLERAISTGIDNQGHTLSPVMPRWKMTKRDLHDVAYYVLTQLK